MFCRWGDREGSAGGRAENKKPFQKSSSCKWLALHYIHSRSQTGLRSTQSQQKNSRVSVLKRVPGCQSGSSSQSRRLSFSLPILLLRLTMGLGTWPSAVISEVLAVTVSFVWSTPPPRFRRCRKQSPRCTVARAARQPTRPPLEPWTPRCKSSRRSRY